MDTQKQIHQYLEKITSDFQPDIDYQIYHFLRRLNRTTLKGLDAYCFSPKITPAFQYPGLKTISLILIHPLPESERALCISLIKNSTINQTTYDISAGIFNLIKTAGDPVDLSAVRMEKVILDAIAGETLEWIRWNGMYRELKMNFQKIYTEKTEFDLIRFLKNLMPKSEKQKLIGQIIFYLKNLEITLLWLIENPELNRFRSRRSFNY